MLGSVPAPVPKGQSPMPRWQSLTDQESSHAHCLCSRRLEKAVAGKPQGPSRHPAVQVWGEGSHGPALPGRGHPGRPRGVGAPGVPQDGAQAASLFPFFLSCFLASFLSLWCWDPAQGLVR